MLAGGLGFEPRLTGPEPVVLPLDDPPVSCKPVHYKINFLESRNFVRWYRPWRYSDVLIGWKAIKQFKDITCQVHRELPDIEFFKRKDIFWHLSSL